VELLADPRTVVTKPKPLGRTSIAVLARAVHGLDPDDYFCSAVEVATGGNPLFVGAVLDTVSREGMSPTSEQVPRLVEISAHGVARAIGLRLARLPSPALGLLRAAAVLGDGAEPRSF
jgi:predicted ATPase